MCRFFSILKTFGLCANKNQDKKNKAWVYLFIKMQARVDENLKFFESLTTSRAGRVLKSHFACTILHETGNPRDSSMQEALSNEKVLMTAISQSVETSCPLPCGLPTPIPKFLAIVNLSGERALLYSDNPALVRNLCSQSQVLAKSEVEREVCAFCEFPLNHIATIHKFVLVSFSLPWQAGVDSSFWTLSACSFSGVAGHVFANVIDDRMLTFSSHSLRSFSGRPVLDPTDAHIRANPETRMKIVDKKQIHDLNETYACCSLDVKPIPQVDGNNDSLVSQRLNAIVAALKTGRTADQREIRQLKTALEEMHEQQITLVQQCEERIASMKDDCKKRVDEADSRCAAVQMSSKELVALHATNQAMQSAETANVQTLLDKRIVELNKATKSLEKTRASLENQKKHSMAKDSLANSAASQFKIRTESNKRTIESLQCDLRTQEERLHREFSQKLEGVETSYLAEQCRLATALDSKRRIIDQLSKSSEVVEGELAELKLRLDAVKDTKRTSATMTNSSTTTHCCASTQTAPSRANPGTGVVPREVATPELRRLCSKAKVAVSELVRQIEHPGGGFFGASPSPHPQPPQPPLPTHPNPQIFHPNHAREPPLYNHQYYTHYY